MGNKELRQHNDLALLFGSKCQIGVLKIHEIPLVKTAKLFKNRGFYAEKATAAKIYLGRVGYLFVG